MNELEKFNQKTMSSREIAELTGKRHDHVLRDCDALNETYKKMGLPTSGEGSYNVADMEEYHRGDRTQYKYLKADTFDKVQAHFNKCQYPLIQQGYYTHPNTGDQQHREYLLTKMQCFDLLTGYRTDLRIKVNRRWEELETKQLDFTNPQTVLQLVQNWADEQQKRLELQAQNEEMRPKALFADAVATSDRSVLVAELAKILNQNGVNIGQNRLFVWLRENGYLCSKGEYYNQPTQKAMDLGLFELKKTSITKPDGSVLVTCTTKVTGKGQIYFINKFLTEKAA